MFKGTIAGLAGPAIIPQTSSLTSLDTQVNGMDLPLLQWKESLSLGSGQWEVSRNYLYHFRAWPVTFLCVTLCPRSPSASLMHISTVTLETVSGRYNATKKGPWISTWGEVTHQSGILGFSIRNKCLPCLSHYTVLLIFVTVTRITFTSITGFSISGKKYQNHDSWLFLYCIQNCILVKIG